MLALSERKLKEFTSGYLGTVRPALIEHPRRDGSMSAFTDNYLRINLTNPDAALANTVVNVVIDTPEPDNPEECRGHLE